MTRVLAEAERSIRSAVVGIFKEDAIRPFPLAERSIRNAVVVISKEDSRRPFPLAERNTFLVVSR